MVAVVVTVPVIITMGWDSRSHRDLSGFRRRILHGRILINKDGDVQVVVDVDVVVDGGDVCMKEINE